MVFRKAAFASGWILARLVAVEILLPADAVAVLAHARVAHGRGERRLAMDELGLVQIGERRQRFFFRRTPWALWCSSIAAGAASSAMVLIIRHDGSQSFEMHCVTAQGGAISPCSAPSHHHQLEGMPPLVMAEAKDISRRFLCSVFIGILRGTESGPDAPPAPSGTTDAANTDGLNCTAPSVRTRLTDHPTPYDPVLAVGIRCNPINLKRREREIARRERRLRIARRERIIIALPSANSHADQ